MKLQALLGCSVGDADPQQWVHMGTASVCTQLKGRDMGANCYKCKHRGNVPGDAHSCCHYPGNETGIFDLFSTSNFENRIKLNITADLHGIRSGWFMWPVNFDPVWLRNCDGFDPK